MKKVEVYVMISGDYCSFSEMSFNIVYDITNNIQLDDYRLEELENWKYTDYSDVKKCKAILEDNNYFILL